MRIAIPPGLVDHTGNPVTGPRRPPAWTQWERCDEAILMPQGWIASMDQAKRAGVMHPSAERWLLKRRLMALSSLQPVAFRGETRWQWLVSMSAFGRRATNEQVQRVLQDFGVPNAEEDNHQPGIARMFWRSIDLPPDATTECECKSDATTVIEPDGYTWQREADYDPAGYARLRARIEAQGPDLGSRKR